MDVGCSLWSFTDSTMTLTMSFGIHPTPIFKNSGSSPLPFFHLAGNSKIEVQKREEKGMDGRLITWPFPSCPNFIALSILPAP
jgi:hypothetical protein